MALALLAGTSVSSHAADSGTIGTLDLATVARYFAEFDSLCARDGGAIWGVSYAGPVLIVDPATRRVAASRADSAGTLERSGTVWIGTLPPDQPVANTAVNWLGTRWTMLMANSLPENLRPRLRLMGHEAFHRLQPQLGLEASGAMNDHLDTRDGRFWMQLEWNALQRALRASGAARVAAIEDARRFRAVRRAAFAGAAERERALEIQEGLAEYAGARLVGYSDSTIVSIVVARRAWDTNFVRSFAYVSGPLYGFLLDGTGAGWRRGLTPISDLGDRLAEALRLKPLPPRERTGEFARTRATAYGGDSLWSAESERERVQNERLATWRRTLIVGPVLILDLKSIQSGTFDPGQVFPMGDGRTVYATRALAAPWGELSVEGGAILEDPKLAQGRVALTGASDDHTHGTGWTLKLAPGWRIVPAQRAGDFELARP